MTVRYRNTDTGDINNYGQPMPRLEQSEKWVRVDSEEARPNVSDPKDVWVTYAQAKGVDTEGLTKDELIDAVG